MRLPRAIYLLPPQGKSFLICPKHFSFVTSAASLTLWNVRGLQVDWSVECKWMLCPTTLPSRSKFVQFDQSQKPVTPLPSLLPLSLSSLSFPTLSCISATAITIKHHRHFYSTFRLRLFAVFRQPLPLFSFPFLVSLSP